MFQVKFRVKPVHCEYKDVETVYAVQRKSILTLWFWWTIKYFKTYEGADLWIDKNIFSE